MRAFASESALPSQVCSQINSVLCSNIAPGKFVTLFYGVLDGLNRTLQFTNAGHVQPLLIREGSATQRLENDGALLGVFPDWKYKDSTVELQTGDLVLLFTDGITEAMASDGREFGEERLIGTATNLSAGPLDDLQRGIVEQVKHFCNSHMSDDATLLLIAALRAKPKQRNLAQNDDMASEQLMHFARVRS
jgi:phosphoserine phosphatase RsbU/P